MTEVVPEAIEVVEVITTPAGPEQTVVVLPTSVDGVEVVEATVAEPEPAVEILVPGERGPAGPPGDGAPGGYLHTQVVPSTVWDVDHQLGFDPAAIRVVGVDGDEWWPASVTYITEGQVVRLTFNTSVAGTARVS